MDLLRNEEAGIFAVTGDMTTACQQYDLVSIADDNTVSKAAKGDITLGTVIALPMSFPGKVSIQTKYRNLFKVLVSADVNAGQLAKLDTPTEAGIQRICPWVAETDSPTIIEGLVWKGATAGNYAELFTN